MRVKSGARAALGTVKKLLPGDDATQLLEFGGLREVEQTVAAIEEFLAKPRLRDVDTPS